VRGGVVGVVGCVVAGGMTAVLARTGGSVVGRRRSGGLGVRRIARVGLSRGGGVGCGIRRRRRVGEGIGTVVVLLGVNWRREV
jgi:hypothetical protein